MLLSGMVYLALSSRAAALAQRRTAQATFGHIQNLLSGLAITPSRSCTDLWGAAQPGLESAGLAQLVHVYCNARAWLCHDHVQQGSAPVHQKLRKAVTASADVRLF